MKRHLMFLLTITASTSLAILPAAAHTSVVTTIPQYKSTLAELPKKFTIEFTEDLMNLGAGKVNTLEITDPTGSQIAGLVLSVSGRKISAELPSRDFPVGTYLISYRVVSADGHPVSGSYEIYLKQSSGHIGTSTSDSSSHSFFHIHRTHFYQSGTALILIILWWGYRRFTREEGA